MRTRLRLPLIYPITDVRISQIPHAEQVTLLSDAGATFIQLREKNLAALDFYNDVKAALAVARKRNVTLIINDRVDVALAAGAPGVHLGQEDLPPDAARKLLGDDAIIGFSTHNLEQAIAAAEFPVDYIAIGPIFETGTKSNPDPVVGLEGLRAVRKAIGNLHLVAIGGITVENAASAVEAGADSVALVSALLSGGPTDISRRYLALSHNLPAR